METHWKETREEVSVVPAMWYLVCDWTTTLILVHRQCRAGYSCDVFG